MTRSKRSNTSRKCSTLAKNRGYLWGGRIKAPFNVGDIVRNKDDHNGRLYRVCRETACYMSLIDVERGLPFTMQRHKRVLARDWELVE